MKLVSAQQTPQVQTVLLIKNTVVKNNSYLIIYLNPYIFVVKFLSV